MDAGTRQFVTIIVVVMVMLVGLLAALSLLIGDAGPWLDGDGNEEDEDWYWDSRTDTMVVTGDVEWRDMEMTLDHEVTVNEGGRLRIVDSRVEVPLEATVLEGGPWFYVDPGCSLEVEGSHLVVQADPQLDGAWFCKPDDYSSNCMWRVVNLQGAEDPVLEFDVEFWYGWSSVVVAVQKAPGQELVPLEVVMPDSVELREWAHVSVRLDGLEGTTPRVMVLVHNATSYDVLLSGLRVTDGGEPLEGDLSFTGDPERDGWWIERWERFNDRLRRRVGWNCQLVHSIGEVTIVDSEVSSLPGLYHGSPDYWPQRERVVPTDSHTIHAAARGLGINVSGTKLTLVDSRVDYVPISAYRCTLDVRGTVLKGDNEMLTLFRCSGIVKGCGFSYNKSTEVWGRSTDDRLWWQLAVERENGGEMLTVEGCHFTGLGEGIGIHMNHGVATFKDCQLDGFEVAVWNHDTTPSPWSQVLEGFTFGGSNDLRYLVTNYVKIEYVGIGRPTGDAIMDGYWHTIRYNPGPDVPIDLYQYETEVDTLACAPTYIVDGAGDHEWIDNLTVTIDPDWTAEDLVTFDPSRSSVIHVFEQPRQVHEEYYYAFIQTWHREGNGTGTVEQDIYIGMWAENMVSAQLEFYWDDVLEYRIDLADAGHDWSDGSVVITRNQTVPPGTHEGRFELHGRLTPGGEVMRMAYIKNTYHRVTEGMPSLDPIRVDDGLSEVIIVDPGLEAMVEGLESRAVSHFEQSLDIVASEDAMVTIRNVHTLGYGSLMIFVSGPGEVILQDLSSYNLNLIIVDAYVTVEDVESGLFWGYFEWSEVHFQGDLEAFEMKIGVEDASFSMDGVTNHLSFVLRVDGERSDIVLDRCTMPSEGMRLLIDDTFNSTVRMTDCDLPSTFVEVGPLVVNTTVEVTGNRFTGSGAVLALRNVTGLEGLWGLAEPAGLVGSVSGNTFSGPGSGLVFMPVHRQTILGENTFDDGALAWARYFPELTFTRTGHDYHNNLAITPDSWGFLVDAYGTLFDESEGVPFLLDVTLDPLAENDPHIVSVVICEGLYSPVVVGFGAVDLKADGVTLWVPSWGEVGPLIEDMLRGIKIEDNWWTSG